MGQIKIRKMKDTDINNTVKIIKRTMSKADSIAAKKDFMSQSEKEHSHRVNYVALLDNKIVGVIGFWRMHYEPKDVAYMDWFAVDSDFQHHGIGSKLLEYLVSKLAQQGYTKLCVEKSNTDIESTSFYRDHGFIQFGRLKDYWDDGGDLVLLVKLIKQ